MALFSVWVCKWDYADAPGTKSFDEGEGVAAVSFGNCDNRADFWAYFQSSKDSFHPGADGARIPCLLLRLPHKGLRVFVTNKNIVEVHRAASCGKKNFGWYGSCNSNICHILEYLIQ
jgi:hypothetical protein